MPQISQQKKDKIAEQILHYLFSSSPEPKFTSEIAQDIARDEEFIKSFLQDLEKKKLVLSVTKNQQGIEYSKRKRWVLTNEAFQAYQREQLKHQPNNNNLYNSLAFNE